MKKRIFYYFLLILAVGLIFVFNYSSVQNCGDITITNVTTGNSRIVFQGKLNGKYRSVRSIKTEKIGNDFYIKIEAVNDFFGSKPKFEVSIPNKNNSVKRVLLADKDDSKEIYVNSNFDFKK